MAKFKPVGGKAKSSAKQSGVPCLILLISGVVLLMLFLYFVMSSSG
ncbi:MAG: hypothetical protein ACRD8O_00495 [Bryobacteraceae bacterium]